MNGQVIWDKSKLQNLKAEWKKLTLNFKNPSGTSRGVLLNKESFLIFISNKELLLGVGEVSVIRGLSADDIEEIPNVLNGLCDQISDWENYLEDKLLDFPAVKFGLEMALLDLQNGGRKCFYENSFYNSDHRIPINGLIWMGTHEQMYARIEEKLNAGFDCLKLKIGAIDFENEVSLLEGVRKRFKSSDLELRVDANGAFDMMNVQEKLKRLAEFEIHSIEQPIRQGDWVGMRQVCMESPIPVALDEELIGLNGVEKERCLNVIQPQFIILKPSLVGGFKESSEWIALAEERNIGWWITSALESNIGLNAIAQFTADFDTSMYQGLGTGGLYTNNIESPLEIVDAHLSYSKEKVWQVIG